eukprot:m.56055 g.56055  ORF g.56055 m.56055 type:complete len:499 (-) comp22174_c0_seq1:64-1560(-)
MLFAKTFIVCMLVLLSQSNMCGAASDTRPLPIWAYTKPRGGLSGVAWFGANESGFENESQLEMLGNYSMVVFGWQAFLTGYNYTGELDLLVQQGQIVKARHPNTAVIIYIDGLRVQPFYSTLKPIMKDPNYQDFFLRDAQGYIPATTYCRQMNKPADDPMCLCWYWNWYNASAVDFYLNELLLPQISKPGFDGIFFDGSDGFLRDTWKSATNVPAGTTDRDALTALVAVHKRGAELLQAHGKYAIYSEHLLDTTAEQQAYIATQLAQTPYFRFYEGFRPTQAYIEALLNETQPVVGSNAIPPLPVIVHTGASPTASLTDSLAAFMIFSENYSYFMASAGWLDAGWAWHREYDPDYGSALGPAVVLRSPQGNSYTRKYTNCDVTVNCTSDSMYNEKAIGNRFGAGVDDVVGDGGHSAFDCSIFDCTCQGFADYFGTHNGKGFGCAGADAQQWWIAHHCSANANCACCKGPACLLPNASACICPKGGGGCSGEIRMHSLL